MTAARAALPAANRAARGRAVVTAGVPAATATLAAERAPDAVSVPARAAVRGPRAVLVAPAVRTEPSGAADPRMPAKLAHGSRVHAAPQTARPTRSRVPGAPQTAMTGTSVPAALAIVGLGSVRAPSDRPVRAVPLVPPARLARAVSLVRGARFVRGGSLVRGVRVVLAIRGVRAAQLVQRARGGTAMPAAVAVSGRAARRASVRKAAFSSGRRVDAVPLPQDLPSRKTLT